MIYLKEKYAKNNEKQKDQNAFKYDCKRVMIACELKRFSHISNLHNMYTLMQSCNVFHTQHTIFFAILDTCADTM